MAKIILSPLFTEVHGYMDGIVYYFRNGIQYGRIYVKGRNPDTGAQRFMRRTFGDAVRAWQAITEEERYKFNKKARYLNMSGYNLYISQYMKTRIIAGHGPVIIIKRSAHVKAGTALHQSLISSVSPPFPLRL